MTDNIPSTTPEGLTKRVEKWDEALNKIHDLLEYLHSEFDSFYITIQEIKKAQKNARLEG